MSFGTGASSLPSALGTPTRSDCADIVFSLTPFSRRPNRKMDFSSSTDRTFSSQTTRKLNTGDRSAAGIFRVRADRRLRSFTVRSGLTQPQGLQFTLSDDFISRRLGDGFKAQMMTFLKRVSLTTKEQQLDSSSLYDVVSRWRLQHTQQYTSNSLQRLGCPLRQSVNQLSKF
jgi:hypothetical protein